MPNIREYSAPQVGVSQVRPSDGGANALEQAARTSSRMASQREGDLASVGAGMERSARASAVALRDVAEGIKNVGEAVGSYVADHQERQEFSRFYATASKIENEATRSWAEARANADPNDPAVMSKFNDEYLAPKLQEFVGGFGTKAGQQRAEEWAGRFTSHMLTQQISDQSMAAKIAFDENVSTFKNMTADNLMFDPSALDFKQEQTRSMFADFSKSPTLTEEMRANLKAQERTVLRDNARAAFVGMARANPDAALAELDAGFAKDVLDEQDRRALMGYGKMEQTNHREQAQRDQVELRRQQGEAVDRAMVNVMVGTIDPDTGAVRVPNNYSESIRQIATMPGVKPGDVTTMMNFRRTLTQDEITGRLVQTDAATYDELWSRARLDPSDPNRLTAADLMNARNDHTLSNRDYADLNKFISKPVPPERRAAEKQLGEFFTGMKSSMTKSNMLLGIAFPEQDQRFYQFKRDMRERFDNAYADGSWKDMLDPRSNNYMGKLAAPYMLSTKEGMQKMGELMNAEPTIATPVPEQPGQTKAKPSKSIDDFMNGK